MVSMGRDDFVVNSQQDVPEVLNYLLDNFCGISVLSQDQIKVVIRNRITCTNCLQSDDREDIHMILKLNVAGNVNSAFNNYEVQCRKSYHLVASICHSGTLAAGHYTAHVLHKQDSQWLLCNDKAVLPIQSSEVDNKLSYVLFYELS